jgi:hypothetical protein
MHEIVDPTFNRQRTVQKRTIGGKEVEVVTELVLETALPLVLTQDANKASEPNHQFVPESAHLKVFGDDVTVLGKLSCPGRSLQIFSRVLRAKSDGGVPPTISVDGPELPEASANPKALPKGASPPDKPTKVKVLKGRKGDDGYNERVQPVYLEGEKMEPGKPGWTSVDHIDEMWGEPGKPGEKGFSAGEIFILCGETDFAAPLRLSAVGGPGGNGQPGQDGANGGDGGKGFDAEAVNPLVGAYRKSTAGGNGGLGGTGGRGGQGGQGGDGGRIVVHSLQKTYPTVDTACVGGRSGAPGGGGNGGEKGFGGAGGNSVWLSMVIGSGREIPGSPKGLDGHPGNAGLPGLDAPSSQSGSARATVGEVPKEVLAQLASVSQLQMLFERIRADYLVTEAPGYDLHLQSVLRAEDIVAQGRNLVVAAAVGSRLHVRVFDSSGARVVDSAEGELAGLERLAALKEKLKALKLNLAPAIEMTPRGVLLAGQWVKKTDQEPQGGWRGRLIQVLGDNANLEGRASYYSSLDDGNLSGMVGAIAFLLRAGVCDQRTLARMTPKQQNNTLVDSIQKYTGRSWEEVAGLGNRNLVTIGMEWAIGTGAEWSDTFVRNESVTEIPEKGKQSIFEDLAFLLSDADCLSWYRLGGRLSWVVGILDKIPDDHPQKPLAKKICQSAWTTLTNYNKGFDYYGNTPRFAPILSLDTYLTALESSLGPLKDIEEKVRLYFGALRDQKDATNDLQSAVNQTDKALALLSVRKNKILEEMNDTSEAINRLDGDQKSARNALQSELIGFEGQIKGAFGLSLDTFFNCLFQLAFINVHEPANALDMGTRLGMAGTLGVGQAGMMAASQLGVMIKEAKENVLTKSGERINKEWMLEQVEVVKEDEDLKAELTKRQDGMFAKEGSERLLVKLDKFRDLCRQFYGSLDSARRVRGMLDSFIETITKRNQHIDYYNLLIVALLDLSAEVDKLNLQRTAVQGAIAKRTQPGLPSIATFVSGLYERAKTVCLSDYYHAYRAYTFWALEPYSGFYEKVGGNPGAINYDHLNVAKSELKNDVLKALGKNYRTPNHFPAREEDESSFGRVVVLTKQTHRTFFSDLRMFREAEFELEPATKSSVAPKLIFAPTKAAWCGSDRPDFGPKMLNPFAGMADVRLTKVRAWLVSEYNELYHKVIITHLGEEQFRGPDDKPYPRRREPAEERDQDKRKPQYILHEPVPIPFNYCAEYLTYDEETRDFTPGRLFGGIEGAQDGDLGFPNSGISDLPAAGKYAPIGPFGRWRLEIPKNLNPDLKLADLYAVVFDFHGFHQSFTPHA